MHQIPCPECKGAERYIPRGDLSPRRCETCKGHGFLEAPDCPHCDGRGYQRDKAKPRL